MKKAWTELSNKQKWLIILSILVTIIARILILDTVSEDYVLFLSPWYDHIQNNGGLNSLLTLNADYNLPYQYSVLIMTMIPIHKLYAIKIFSIIFDYILAFYVFRITLKITKDNVRSFAGAILGLMLPTILSNSAGWGQSDAIFTALLVGSIFYVIDEKPSLAMLFYTLSFGFKIQAIFLGPLILILLIKKFFNWRHLLIPVGYYILLSLPILFVGGSFTRIIDIMLMQVNIREGFSFYLPNFFYLFNANGTLDYTTHKYIFITICMLLVLLVGTLCYLKLDIKNKRSILFWAFVFSFMVPFFLIRMHERYYFPAEYFVLLLTMVDSHKYKLLLFDLVFTSFVAYLTVQWWLPYDFNYAFARNMTWFVYPFLTATLVIIFLRSIYLEITQRKLCNIEPTK